MTEKRICLGRTALRVGLTLVLVLISLAPAFPTGAGEEMTQQETEPARLLPFQRVGHTTIYDAANNRLITFGGWNGRRFFNDAWALDPTPGAEAWTQLSPDGAPPPARAQHTAIYDAANGQMIVFGGRSRLVNRNDVWALDLTPGAEAWRKISPDGTAPVPRRMHSAVYDAANGRMVIFGGGGGGGVLDDVWALDLTPDAEAWAELTPSGTPPSARVQHTAVYDVTSERMVTFGGLGPGAFYNDTWALNLTTGAEAWAQLSPAGTPPAPRRGHTAISDVANGWMLIFGGIGSGSFYDDVWGLALTSGAETWSRLSPTGQGPSPRAWHSATRDAANERMIVFGGLGPDMAGAGTHWALSLGASPAWTPFTPTFPDWEAGLGQASGRTVSLPLTNGSARPEVTLKVEDAQPHTVVNVLAGTEAWVVAKIRTTSSRYASDIDVILTVEDDALGWPEAGTRTRPRDEPATWSNTIYMGNGRYLYEDVDLVQGSQGAYSIEVVFKFDLSTAAPSRAVDLTLDTFGLNWRAHLGDTGTVRITSDPEALVVTNKTLLFRYYDSSQVRALLRRLYEEAQGSGYHGNPTAVVLYADRYVPSLKTWDNTDVSYTVTPGPNFVADAFDQWLDGLVSVPEYLLIVGDDNIIPFYRKHSYGIDGVDGDKSEDDAPNPYGAEPVLDELASRNYFFTDNPYGDVAGGTDWEVGDLEIAVGRIVGASAVDMHRFVHNSIRGPKPDSGRAIIASDGLNWRVPGPDNDAEYVIQYGLGYSVNSSLIDANPTKTDVTREMARGFAIMAAANHGEVYVWTAPGGPGPDWVGTPFEVDIASVEMPQYNVSNSISGNRPFFVFSSCRTGLTYGRGWDMAGNPTGSTVWDDSMVYALAHHNASGVIASAGLAYGCFLPAEVCHSETLLNDFWYHTYVSTLNETLPLGRALMLAKEGFDIADNITNKKTVQTFTFYGVPWMTIPRAGSLMGQAQRATPSQKYTKAGGWSKPGHLAQDNVYVMTASLDASTYAITETVEGFDIVEVQGMDLVRNEGEPVLPIANLDLILPLDATITGVVITPTQEVVLSDLDIPTLDVGLPIPGGPLGGYIATPDGTYPPQMSDVETSVLDIFQLARVRVIPVVYDATNDQATLYRSVTVQVTYESPVAVALSHFQTDKTSYALGETVNTMAEIVNVGDTPVTLTAVLVLQDVYGRVVGRQPSGAFEVPAGGSYTLTLGWTGQLDDDAYLARLFVREGEQVVAGASQEIFVARGEITDLTAPEMLTLGEAGTFEVTFANRGASATIAVVGLSIYDADDELVAFLGPQAVTVEGGTSETVSFEWTAAAVSGGTHTASATVIAGGQIYGPASQSFKVGYRIHLPLILKASQ